MPEWWKSVGHAAKEVTQGLSRGIEICQTFDMAAELEIEVIWPRRFLRHGDWNGLGRMKVFGGR